VPNAIREGATTRPSGCPNTTGALSAVPPPPDRPVWGGDGDCGATGGAVAAECPRCQVAAGPSRATKVEVLAPCAGFPLTYPAMLGAHWSTGTEAWAWSPFDPSLQPPSAFRGPYLLLAKPGADRASIARPVVRTGRRPPSCPPRHRLSHPSWLPCSLFLARLHLIPPLCRRRLSLPHHVVAERRLTDVWLACVRCVSVWAARSWCRPADRPWPAAGAAGRLSLLVSCVYGAPGKADRGFLLLSARQLGVLCEPRLERLLSASAQCVIQEKRGGGGVRVVSWSLFDSRLYCTWVGLVSELDSGRPGLLCTPVLTIPSCCAVVGPSFCLHFFAA